MDRGEAQDPITTSLSSKNSDEGKEPHLCIMCLESSIVSLEEWLETEDPKFGRTVSRTKDGWCVRQGLIHVADQSNDVKGTMRSLIEQYGVPNYFSFLDGVRSSRDGSSRGNASPTQCRHDNDSRNPYTDNEGETDAATARVPSTCFESLCRIILAQFVSATSARAAWKKLLLLTGDRLVPESILALTTNVEERLQKPAGLTKAKAASIVDLALNYANGALSEEFLTQKSFEESTIRNALLKVRGIGPWTCDVFLLFYLEKSNILPLGDLVVRKGLTKYFGIDAVAMKNKHAVEQRLASYAPYLSLVSYYMWRGIGSQKTSANSVPGKEDNASVAYHKKRRQDSAPTTPSNATPFAKRRRKIVHKMVTP